MTMCASLHLAWTFGSEWTFPRKARKSLSPKKVKYNNSVIVFLINIIKTYFTSDTGLMRHDHSVSQMLPTYYYLFYLPIN